MSDLSWLNPTPHAIAVYASQPLSPVATQHSLPSGRCPLLGPDFHRLDRTSFPGALIRSPSFDYLDVVDTNRRMRSTRSAGRKASLTSTRAARQTDGEYRSLARLAGDGHV